MAQKGVFRTVTPLDEERVRHREAHGAVVRPLTHLQLELVEDIAAEAPAVGALWVVGRGHELQLRDVKHRGAAVDGRLVARVHELEPVPRGVAGCERDQRPHRFGDGVARALRDHVRDEPLLVRDRDLREERRGGERGERRGAVARVRILNAQLEHALVEAAGPVRHHAASLQGLQGTC